MERDALEKELLAVAYEAHFAKSGGSKKSETLAAACGLSTSTLKGKIVLPVLVSPSWTSGGLCGGNCWGDDANQAVSTDSESEFDVLESFLENFFPEITHKQFRELSKKIQYGEYTDYEYYGNYTENTYKYILVEDLLDILAK